ncbi:sensor histidine kinase [Schwartzia succinivorans]|jgi:signal transduction histidine kinase|uniref:histidine kinase n=1 Tax=Schwartzia succinivorans DSM 10502 TaxID=1123243 RepID=A0A1M4SXE5_9FIRM|nr:ATP-binding protein [Schwartzia succinivorans]MBQ1470025.1 sensor histidine kinase [Schwartzia sp. (in: firmicutes)]MBE6097226.1 cell wall metabolism sensor histidine kinase WalK [Schwartzia succinivorans]MBQ1917868.1 sensor histidine kinase [Schwartzia sp. (in: firmicutes)]MCR5447313.1 cell wall metabolism sensor histidine kinase WalK [Schwartzia sp. (in: firmicutes)]MDY6296215.1 ATP-binding protein [Schwartzia succinivorans]
MAVSDNVFRQSRKQLTFYYSVIMAVFLIVLVFLMHFCMKWAVTSEQARELTETAQNIAYGQKLLLEHPELVLDDRSELKGSQDRLFFYVFDNNGRMLNFSRSSILIEPFVLDIIEDWKDDELIIGEVMVFTREIKKRQVRVMMTSHPVELNGEILGVVFVGKEISAVYLGLRKATWTLAGIAVLALIITTGVGYNMAGRAIIPLKEAYEKQRQFAADASHELRTPLSVVLASAELLDNDPSIKSPFLKQVIGDVRDEVKKMTKLVSDLLVVARSDNQALKLKLTRFDLGEVIDQTMRKMQPLAEKKNITLKREGEKEVFIRADEQKLKQLVLIFVDNALKYTPDGGSVSVRLSTPSPTRVSFDVQDTGIGISPEDQQKVFDRFYRVDKARSREMGGNGLGLAIAQEIVRLHNGIIDLKSEQGKGTTFTVTLRRGKE